MWGRNQINIPELVRSTFVPGTVFEVWGTNYFSLFVSYRFMSNKTQLTEFPESKSDIPLFLWVLAMK